MVRVRSDCCEENDDFDLCSMCRGDGITCACTDKQMLTMQKCVAGDVILSEKGDILRRMATITELRCTPCQRLISQGRYYREWETVGRTRQDTHEILTDCPECGDSGFDLCQDCYRQGETCHAANSHRLYAYLRANVDGSHPALATDGICCKACSQITKQGPFYRR